MYQKCLYYIQIFCCRFFNQIIAQFLFKNSQINIMSSNQFKSIVYSLLANIDKDLQTFPLLQYIQHKTGVRPANVFVGIILIVSFLAIFEVMSDILTTLFGMLYPSYMSFKAIQSKIDQQKKIWLTYWIVFGLLVTCDDIFWIILQFVPGFYALRFIFYVWMFYPRPNNGATIIYSLIRPLLLQLNKKINTLSTDSQKKQE